MKKEKSPKIVQKKTCSATECKKASAVSGKEENLKKLDKSGKIKNFVKKNKGSWNHQSWLILCAEIVQEGYEPIDFDQVGLIAEKHKADFLTQI